MKPTFIFFLFLFATLSISAQQKVSSLKSGGDDGSILSSSTDTTIKVDVIPVSLSSEKMPLTGDISISPNKTQTQSPKNSGGKASPPAKASDKKATTKGSK